MGWLDFFTQRTGNKIREEKDTELGTQSNGFLTETTESGGMIKETAEEVSIPEEDQEFEDDFDWLQKNQKNSIKSKPSVSSSVSSLEKVAQQMEDDIFNAFSESDAPAKEKKGYAEDCKYNYIQIILDETWSMKEYIVPVYHYIDRILHEIKSNIADSSMVAVFYGLTVIQSDIRTITFGGQEYTDDIEVFMNKLKTTTLGGGSGDGYEDIESAMKTAILSLDKHCNKMDNRGLFLFTDSEPRNKVFNLDEINGREMHGLRFATIFMQDPELFVPTINYVDGQNETACNNSKNGSVYYDFSILLDGGHDSDAQLRRIVNTVINSVSIGG